MADEIALAPAGTLRIVWQPEAIGQPGAYRIEGPLEPGAALRVFSGKTEDGSAIVLCTARPPGAAHHGEDAVAAAVLDSDGAVAEIAEALVSTEYAADGSIRRLGFELYRTGADYPVRAAADARSTEDDGTAFDLRLGGSSGTAILEIVTA